MWLKSNLFVILVILLVINLFDESYAKGGMAKNSGKRKFFFLVKDGPSRPNRITIFLSTSNLPIVFFEIGRVDTLKVLCELLKKFGHCFRFTTSTQKKNNSTLSYIDDDNLTISYVMNCIQMMYLCS